MLHIPSFDPCAPTEVVMAGQLVRQRHQKVSEVLYVESGRIVQGIRDGNGLRHHLGTVDGPVWLDAAFALAQQPVCIDMQADTRVRVRRVSIHGFMEGVRSLPDTVQSLMQDMAHGYCQQVETAVSRLAQDAEARCAQWLLRHAQQGENGTWRVVLHERKRLIAAQLGIAPETFSRVLRNLRETGLIAGTGNELNLPKLPDLQTMAGV